MKRTMVFLLALVMLVGTIAVPTNAFARGRYDYDRHGGGRHYYDRHGGYRGGGGGFGWDDAWKFALANAVVGTVVDAARGMPLWYDPHYTSVTRQPVCGWEPSVVFDAYRQPIGTMSVWRCY